MGYRVGVDIGGTFTDCVAVHEDTGEVLTAKVPTTPQDQSLGFLAVLRRLGIDLSEISLLLHGCTVGLNAILTRTGAKVGLLTTAGFRDVVAMGRGQRPSAHQFDPRWRREFGDGRRPFCPRYLRRTVPERIDSDGEVVLPLDTDAARREIEFLRDHDVDAIAVCFLNSYANPVHEEQAAEIVRSEAPGVRCWTSTQVHPCFKEYPRFSTCLLNTYVGPLLDAYLDRAQQRVRDDGYAGTLMMMQSNGGVLPASIARERPAYTLQSGPTGGVMAAREWGAELGLGSLLTLDIGGTSADYAIIDEGQPVVTTELELEHDVIVALPAVNVHSIGAGGGSVAWIDRLGALRVGPASAGADPGPACYGHGGTEPTVTDALAVLGILSPRHFMQGELTFLPELAREAIGPIARRLGTALEVAAQAIVDVAVANMVEAAREVSVYNGIDPRDFALYVYGAAGPVFASRIGRELAVAQTLVPPHPGETSAYGLAMADVRLDLGASLVHPLDALDPDRVHRLYDRLEHRAREILAPWPVETLRWLDGRYEGQTWETPSVPVPQGSIDDASVQQVRNSFHETHSRVWGYALREHPIKATMARITATAGIGRPAKVVSGAGAAPAGPLDGQEGAQDMPAARIFLEGAWQSLPLLERARLPVHQPVRGPALIVQPTSTVLLTERDEARTDETGHLWIR